MEELEKTKPVDAPRADDDETGAGCDVCMPPVALVGADEYDYKSSLCANQPVCRVHDDDAAVLVPSSGEEPTSPRHRAGVASMAWRTTAP